ALRSSPDSSGPRVSGTQDVEAWDHGVSSASSREAFPQIIIAMMAGGGFEHRKQLIAPFLIEARCLAVVGVENHRLTSTGSGILLCGLEELRAHALAPQALIDPECTDITTAIPGPAFDPRTEALLVIADKDREPLSIVHPGLRGIILVEAVVQTLDVS